MAASSSTPPVARVLLSLDGGGIRGLSALIILEYLMKRINPENPPKPCDVFDLIGGTSTGGLIAIMLGRLKMDVTTCIDEYLRLASSVFIPKRDRANFLGRLVDKINVKEEFSANNLEDAIKRIVELYLGDGDSLLEEDSDPVCRVFVCTLAKDIVKRFRLRSYRPEREAEAVASCKIWEAARATSAAPSFFKPIKIGKFGTRFIDAAIGYNNPTPEVESEAREIWGDDVKIHCLISIGTGKPHIKPFGGQLAEVAATLVRIATETEHTADGFPRSHPGLRDQYFRFNVPKGLEEVGINEHEKMSRISTVTVDYLNELNTRTEVEKCLTLLTRSRTQIVQAQGGDTSVGELLKFTDDEKECLARLYPADYSGYRSRVSKRHPGTLEWFLIDDRYKAWVTTNSSLLLVSGNPGCGKTVLSAFLLDQLDEMMKDTNNKVVYFFCDDKDERQKTAERLLRGLIHQLIVYTPSLIKHAMPHWTARGTGILRSLDTLWKIFLAITTDPASDGTYCVLDALDECEELSREELLLRLGNHFKLTDSDIQKGYINVILTTRPCDSIDYSLYRFSATRLKTENEEGHIREDIARFITHEVERLAETRGYTSNLKARVQEALEEGSDGMFLWVVLIIKDLAKTRVSLVERTLRTLPRGLDAVYQKLFLGMDNDTREMARRLLLFVVTAIRPLNISELAIAINILPSDTRSSPSENESLWSFEKDIALCGPIVKVQDGTVYLIHQSAKEFLTGSNVIPSPALSDFRISSLEANCQLAISCLTYLAFDEFEEDPLSEDQPNFRKDVNRRSNNFPFWGYAGHYWLQHIEHADQDNQDLWNAFQRLSLSDTKISQAWWMLGYGWRVTPLIIAAKLGICSFVSRLLGTGTNIEDEIDFDGNPLHSAAFGGHLEIVKSLLNNGADINSQSGYFGTALQAAASCGHGAVVEELLDRGAEINAVSGDCQTALQAAASGGHVAVVQELLDRGADINIQGGHLATSLQAAAFGGHLAVIQLLLSRGAEVNTQGGRFGNALQAAAFGGHMAAVKQLLDGGADINTQGGQCGNALQAAASKGHGSMVIQVLDDNGVEISDQGCHYVPERAFTSHSDVVKLLLRRGADVNAQGGHYGNALQAAAFVGDEVAVTDLLDQGADVNAQGGYYGNALQAAVYRGNSEMIPKLLDNGADVNAQGGYFGNALQAATLSGDEVLVRELINGGAMVNAQGGYYGSALQAAARIGNGMIVKILLASGADPNILGGFYGNALQAAGFTGDSVVVEDILDAGASINMPGGHYGNVLQAAAFGGHEGVVDTLLERGADVNVQGGYYGNPLQAAAFIGNSTIVQRLLERGADAKAESTHGTALDAARQQVEETGDYETVITLLLRSLSIPAGPS